MPIKLTLNRRAKLLLLAIGGLLAWQFLRKREASISLSGEGVRVDFDPIAESVPEADLVNQTANVDTTIAGTVQKMQEIIASTLAQTKQIARELKKPTQIASLRNLFYYLLNNFKYKDDVAGKEQLRTPARSFADRHKGIDCDCLTILICSVLNHWQIPYVIRVVGFKADAGFSHVYPVAKLNGKEVPMDVVIKRWNYEKPYLSKFDF